MLKNMKIRTRMLLSYAVIIALCLAASVAALVMMKQISSNLTSFYKNNYTVTVNAWTARREMQYARADILNAILETNPAESQKKIDSATDALAKMRATFPVIRERFKGDMGLVDELDATLSQAVVYRDQVLDLTAAMHNDEAFKLMKTSYIPLLDELADKLGAIADQADDSAKAMVAQGQQLQTASMVAVAVIIVLSIILAALLALYISEGIRKPVEEIRSTAEKMASGSLEVSLNYQSEDELGNLSDSIRSLISTFQGIISDMGQGLAAMSDGDFTVDSRARELYVGDFHHLADSMDQITGRLNHTLSQIDQSSDQVSAGSDQVSAGALELAQGATEQAASVEELADAINEISAQVGENAKNAQRGSELAEVSGVKIEESNCRMQEMTAAMDDISDKTSQIGKIIKMIEDIAFQTNILALNAGVEAARAGTSGKGFAVIANEVRNLANKSAQASKSTASLIKGSMEAVDQGTRLMDETARTLTEAMESARQAVAVAEKISGASSEQAASIMQVTQNVDQISNVVQNNSATAEESAAASEELFAQAHLLRDLVSQFKLKEYKGTGGGLNTVQLAAEKEY